MCTSPAFSLFDTLLEAPGYEQSSFTVHEVSMGSPRRASSLEYDLHFQEEPEGAGWPASAGMAELDSEARLMADDRRKTSQRASKLRAQARINELAAASKFDDDDDAPSPKHRWPGQIGADPAEVGASHTLLPMQTDMSWRARTSHRARVDASAGGSNILHHGKEMTTQGSGTLQHQLPSGFNSPRSPQVGGGSGGTASGDTGSGGGARSGGGPRPGGIGLTAADLETMDERRVKRILANRRSAARSKQRKTAYIAQLEADLRTLKSDVVGLAEQKASLQQDVSTLERANEQLLQQMLVLQDSLSRRDQESLLLVAELQRLQAVTGLRVRMPSFQSAAPMGLPPRPGLLLDTSMAPPAAVHQVAPHLSLGMGLGLGASSQAATHGSEPGPLHGQGDLAGMFGFWQGQRPQGLPQHTTGGGEQSPQQGVRGGSGRGQWGGAGGSMYPF